MANTNCRHEWKTSLEGAVCKYCEYLKPGSTKCDAFKMRNDNVLIRLVNLERIGGVEMPDVAQQGKERVVISVGPDVEGLRKGDVVLAIGGSETGTYQLLNFVDLWIAKQSNILMVIRNVLDEEKPDE